MNKKVNVQEVKKDSLLIEFDIQKLRENNIDPTTVIVFINRDSIPKLKYEDIEAKQHMLML